MIANREASLKNNLPCYPMNHYFKTQMNRISISNWHYWRIVWLWQTYKHTLIIEKILYYIKKHFLWKKYSNWKLDEAATTIAIISEGKYISNMDSKPINIRWIRTGSKPHWKIMYRIIFGILCILGLTKLV